MGALLAATERSVQAAVKAGLLDEDLNAGPIAALFQLAKVMDRRGFPIVNGKLDNVSPSKYLDYCQRLGLVPGRAVPTPKRTPATAGPDEDDERKPTEGGRAILRGLQGGQAERAKGA